MKFGLSRAEFEFIQQTVVLPFANLSAKVWCFGSRARGDHNKFSDLDLMVESDSDISSVLSSILETLEESDFPYKVDLVSMKNFAASYRDSFERDKVEFNL